MPLSKDQLDAFIDANITDPKLQQNTAAVVRGVLKAIKNASFNVLDDTLSWTNIAGDPSLNTDLVTYIEGLVGEALTAEEKRRISTGVHWDEPFTITWEDINFNSIYKEKGFYALLPDEQIHGIKHLVTEGFSGGTLTSVTMRLGGVVAGNQYDDGLLTDVDVSLDSTAYKLSTPKLFQIPGPETGSNVYANFFGANGNLSELTQGSVTIWLLVSKCNSDLQVPDPDPDPVVVYDTIKTFTSLATATHEEMTFQVSSANANSKFEFNDLDNIVGYACVMLVRVSNVDQIQVSFPSDYLTLPFRITTSTGVIHTSAFSDSTINL